LLKRSWKDLAEHIKVEASILFGPSDMIITTDVKNVQKINNVKNVKERDMNL